MDRRNHLAWHFGGAAALATLLCGVARAGQPGVIDGVASPATHAQLAELVRLLDAPDWGVRTNAQTKIQAIAGDDLPLIESALLQSDLTPEQRLRLDEVGLTVLRRTPRGAMGVTFGGIGGQNRSGVQISQTHAGFESDRVLRAGDVIHALDDVPITDFRQARPLIMSHSPGEVIVVKFFRGQEPLLARLRLGDFSELNSANRQRVPIGLNNADETLANAGIMRECWNVRRRREITPKLPEKPPIDPGIDLAQADRFDQDIDQTELQIRRQIARQRLNQGLNQGVNQGLNQGAASDDVAGVSVGGQAGGLSEAPSSAFTSASGGEAEVRMLLGKQAEIRERLRVVAQMHNQPGANAERLRTEQQALLKALQDVNDAIAESRMRTPERRR